MKQNKKYDRAFSEVEREFPFKGYLDSICYHEVKAILGALELFLPEFEGLKLLDVGSGPMDKTAILQKIGFECSAVDDLGDPWHKLDGKSEVIVNFAKGMGINFYLQNDGDYTIPFDYNYFDVVTANDVIEHLHETPRLILNAMGEHLKSSGYLVIAMPNSVNLRKRISVLMGRTNYSHIDEFFYSLGSYRGHVREYTLSETKYICEVAGFQVVHADTFEHFAYERLPHGLREIYLLAGKINRYLRSGIIVIAQKPKDWKPLEEDSNRYFRQISKFSWSKNILEQAE